MDDTDKLRNSCRSAGVHVELQVIPQGPLHWQGRCDIGIERAWIDPLSP